MESSRMEFSRRDVLKMGAFAGAGLALPLHRAATTKDRLPERLDDRDLPEPFQMAFIRPPVLRPVRRDADTDYYRLVMQRRKASVLPGMKTEIWGYNGIAPGPTIMARRGRNVVVRQINRLPRPTSVHLHGNASRPQFDGYASDTTRPGWFKDYHYPTFQDARTLWYHDHAVGITAQNAYMGCAAFYITHDEHELSLPIPHGRYDVPLVIRDAILAKDGSMIFDDQGESSLYGNVILANGRAWPVMRVERRKYRFRILNAAVSRSFNLALSSGEPLTVIGTDGGLMPAPQQTDSMRVGMAERYEVVIDFAKYRVGQRIFLQNLGLPNNVDFSTTHNIMAFDVAGEATDRRDNAVPAVLNPDAPVMKLRESQAKRTRRLHLKRKGGEWTVNGQTWHDVVTSGFKKVIANPGLGDVEIWELVNDSSGWFHPLHIHLIDFKILDRNGRPPHPYERGPKDVAYVGESERVRVITRFGPHEGRYMVHCHNLVHEDHDMMVQFQVGGPGPHPVNAARPKPASQMKPL